MERSLIRIQGEASGWACTNCGWTVPVPTLLSGDDAMAAYDRLAAAKFRDHKCEAHAAFPRPRNPPRRRPTPVSPSVPAPSSSGDTNPKLQ